MKKENNQNSTNQNNDYYEYYDVGESSEFGQSEYELDEDYADVYDEDGDSVICDFCGGRIKFENGEYVCPDCGQTMSRETFFNYIGADIPGDECLNCDSLYPGCTQCPHGYFEED